MFGWDNEKTNIIYCDKGYDVVESDDLSLALYIEEYDLDNSFLNFSAVLNSDFLQAQGPHSRVNYSFV